MDVQIPHRVHPQVSKKSDIWTIPGRSQGNHTESLPIQGHRDYRRPYDAGSRSLVVKYTTKVQCIGNHGVPQRKECTDDLRQTRKPEVKYGNRHFWAEGYYVSTVGLNETTIRKYIQDQKKHDIALDKLSVKEYEDPFRGQGK